MLVLLFLPLLLVAGAAAGIGASAAPAGANPTFSDDLYDLENLRGRTVGCFQRRLA
jgi:hypothetical protein